MIDPATILSVVYFLQNSPITGFALPPWELRDEFWKHSSRRFYSMQFKLFLMKTSLRISGIILIELSDI